MATLTRNIVSSVVERIVTTGLTIVTVPFQVRFLGIEAYGILGFVASLQVVFNILDLGLGPTVIREVAGDPTRSRDTTRIFIATVTSVYWTVAIVLGVGMAVAAPWVARDWLSVANMPTASVVTAIRLIAIAILLRWPVALYSGMLSGAQRLDLVNGIRTAISILRLLGGVLVVIVTRSVSSYLLWIVLTTALELAAYVIVCRSILPGIALQPGFSRSSLLRVWQLSAHMNAISVLSVVLVQSDRLVISRVLPIAELGFYSVAYTAAMGIPLLQSIVSGALLPALAAQMAAGDSSAVRSRCRAATQLLTFAVCGCAGVMIFFGAEALSLWISADTAARAAVPLAVLATGFVFSAVVTVPQTLAVAAGRTWSTLVVNAIAAVVYVPLVLALVRRWGIDGAPWAWVALNACYLLILVPLLQRSLPMEPVGRWFLRNVLPFAALAVIVFGGADWMSGRLGGSGSLTLSIALMAGLVYAGGGVWLIDSSLRELLLGSGTRRVIVQGS